ncbi:unnamed protein product [Jaminaea pallidilutea]
MLKGVQPVDLTSYTRRAEKGGSQTTMASRPPGQGGHSIARPVGRYRPGKAPVAGADVYIDDDDDEDSIDEGNDASRQAGQGREHGERHQIRSLSSGTASLLQQSQGQGKARTAGVVVNLAPQSTKTLPKQEKLEPQYDSDEYETDTDASEDDAKPNRPAATAGVDSKAPQSESEYESDSEEEESEEEEPEPIFKPMFMSKKQREAAAANVGRKDQEVAPPSDSNGGRGNHNTESNVDTEAERLAAERRLEAQQIASERIKQELLAKQAEDSKPDLDDTDGLDPAGEFAAWRIRELQRIKREWEAEEAKEADERERERRAAMTEAERSAEDTAKADLGRKEAKENRGKMGFMQKYYHKGAFFQDLDILKKRDYSTERTEGSVNVENLPSIMQVRDYGKKGRSKYTHLGAEDTSKGGISLRGGSGGGKNAASSSSQQGCFHCGSADHIKKECPVFAEERQKERETRFQERRRDGGWQQRERRLDDNGSRTPAGDRLPGESFDARLRAPDHGEPHRKRHRYDNVDGGLPTQQHHRDERHRHSANRREDHQRSTTSKEQRRPQERDPEASRLPARDRWAERQREKEKERAAAAGDGS